MQVSAEIAAMKPQGRARKTNGKTPFLGKVDGRSVAARRFRDLEQTFRAELGGKISTLQGMRVANAAALTVRLEQLHTAIAAGDPGISDEDLVRVSNALRRELSDLGLADQDTAQEKPGLDDYLKGRAA